MKTLLQKYLSDLFSSYWFVPTLMALFAMGLAIGAVALDRYVGVEWISGSSWMYESTAEGARILLSTVAGSMIGVAGVTFSITIVSVVYASGQYGPRLLQTFMADRGNQVTLGTFIATFLYCLLVLGTVQSGEENAERFVPQTAITVALGLAVCSIGVLIYFIHHVPLSIHVSRVISVVGNELRRKVDALFPDELGESIDEQEVEIDESSFGQEINVRSKATGYIQGIDEPGLLAFARKKEALLDVKRRPGEFAAEGDLLVRVLARDRLDEEEDAEQIQQLFVFGTMRTALQDALFLIREIMEIAARALSPGVTDPRTAMDCLDWIGASIKEVAQRKPLSDHRADEDGVVRVIVKATTFDDFLDESFRQLRPYLAADPNAGAHAMDVLGEILVRTSLPEQRELLLAEAKLLHASAEETLPDRAGLARVKAAFEAAFSS